MPGKKKSKAVNIRKSAASQYLLEIKDFLDKSPNILAHIEGNGSQREYQELYDALIKIQNLKDERDGSPKYFQKLYTEFHEALENVAQVEFGKEVEQRAAGNLLAANPLDPLFIQVYENNNKIHEKIYVEIIQDDKGSPAIHESDEEKLKARLKERNVDPYSQRDPRHPNNKLNDAVSSGAGIAYHPLIKNNVPYVAYEEVHLSTSTDPATGPKAKCLRMGAQTHSSETLNPTFQRYLSAKERAEGSKAKQTKTGTSDTPYDFVYFCLLRTNPKKTFGLTAVYAEGKRSSALHSLEKTNSNIAVVNLPADGSFFKNGWDPHKPYVEAEEKKGSLGNLLATTIDSIKENKNDFNISDGVKKKVFPPPGTLNKTVEELFQKSVKEVLGKDYDPAIEVSAQERNAILFQFIKFNLTQHILEKLSPNAYAIVCKDGIDRGGIHTLWFHMSLQYSQNKPMEKDEFLKHLDAPAMLVKGRPLNHNRDFLWNVLSHRMQNDEAFRNSHLWAEEWLKNNQPISCKSYILVKLDRAVDVLAHKDSSTGVDNRTQTAKVLVSKKEPPYTGIKAEVTISDEQWNRAVVEMVKNIKEKALATIPEKDVFRIDPKNHKIQDKVHQVNIERKPDLFEVSSQKSSPEVEAMVSHYKTLARESGVEICVIDSSPSPEITAKLITSLLSKDPAPAITPVIEDEKILKELRDSKSPVCQSAVRAFEDISKPKNSILHHSA